MLNHLKKSVETSREKMIAKIGFFVTIYLYITYKIEIPIFVTNHRLIKRMTKKNFFFKKQF